MPTSIMQKNYSHCPLKKRPVYMDEEPAKNGNCLCLSQFGNIKILSFEKKVLNLNKGDQY